MFFTVLKSVGLNQIITSLRKYLEGKTRERVNVRSLYSLVCKSVHFWVCVCERKSEREYKSERVLCEFIWVCEMKKAEGAWVCVCRNVHLRACVPYMKTRWRLAHFLSESLRGHWFLMVFLKAFQIEEKFLKKLFLPEGVPEMQILGTFQPF